MAVVAPVPAVMPPAVIPPAIMVPGPVRVVAPVMAIAITRRIIRIRMIAVSAMIVWIVPIVPAVMIAMPPDGNREIDAAIRIAERHRDAATMPVIGLRRSGEAETQAQKRQCAQGPLWKRCHDR
jgi:hypothetical protein